MSIYPCDFHGQRIRGALSTAYVSALDGSARYQRRLRLCSKDLAELRGQHGSHWELVADEGDADFVAVCASCGVIPSESRTAWQVFATLFPHGAERQDFYATLHEACAEAYVTQLGLKLEPPR